MIAVMMSSETSAFDAMIGRAGGVPAEISA